MIEAPRGLSGVEAAQMLLNRGVGLRDEETRLAAALRRGEAPIPPAPAWTPTELQRTGELQPRRIAEDILRSVESRLMGRIRDLAVRVERGRFVLSGVSSSYYVKQMAQHLAMTALDKRMLGRLVNEIEVRTVR
jgi:hypothetical protein